jgi:hypothetical protein
MLTFILQTVHIDQMSGASTVLFTFTLDRGITWEVFFFFLLFSLCMHVLTLNGECWIAS